MPINDQTENYEDKSLLEAVNVLELKNENIFKNIIRADNLNVNLNFLGNIQIQNNFICRLKSNYVDKL